MLKGYYLKLVKLLYYSVVREEIEKAFNISNESINAELMMLIDAFIENLGTKE